MRWPRSESRAMVIRPHRVVCHGDRCTISLWFEFECRADDDDTTTHTLPTCYSIYSPLLCAAVYGNGVARIYQYQACSIFILRTRKYRCDVVCILCPFNLSAMKRYFTFLDSHSEFIKYSIIFICIKYCIIYIYLVHSFGACAQQYRCGHSQSFHE